MESIAEDVIEESPAMVAARCYMKLCASYEKRLKLYQRKIEMLSAVSKAPKTRPTRASAAAASKASNPKASPAAQPPIFRLPSKPKAPAMKDMATAAGVSHEAVRRHVASLKRSGDIKRSYRIGGRPRALTEAEETAIVAYVQWLNDAGCPCTPAFVVAEANELRNDRGLPPVSKMWFARFMKDHPELEKGSRVKPVEAKRQAYEVGGIEETQRFFDRLEEQVREHRAGGSEVWNTDESGFRIGVVASKLTVILVKKEKINKTQEVLNPNNRESGTLCCCGSGSGDTIPGYVIFKQWPYEEWANLGLNPKLRFAASPKGFSNKSIMLDWLKFWNRESYTKSARFISLGYSFIQWFGCDEHLRMPGWTQHQPAFPADLHWAQRNNPENADKTVHRILILDGFAGHIGLDIKSYCAAFDILLGFLPPHSTHLLQPMDVSVFQPLKQRHQRVLVESIHKGNLTFSRSDFVAHLEEILAAGLTKHNIMTGFEKTGLWPVRRHAAFEAIRKDIEKKNKPVPAEILNLLPYTGRYEKAGNTVRHIEEKYVNLMSSPTREAFTHVLAVVSEGSTMRRALKKTNEAKKERLAKSRSSRKKLVKPNQTPDQFARDDPFDTTGISLSFQEGAAISRRQEQHQRAETKAEYEASKWKLDPTKDFGPDPSLFEGMYRASPLGYRGQISKQAFNRAQDEG